MMCLYMCVLINVCVHIWVTLHACVRVRVLGVLGTETVLSATIRRWLAQKPALARELFGRERLPSLLQYDPYHRYLEVKPDDGTLAITTLPVGLKYM